MYWILFWPFFSLAANRNPLWLALFVGPLALASYGWFLCGIKGRPPERGACATLGLLDLSIICIVAAQKAIAGELDDSLLRAAVGFPVVLWLTFGLPTPQFGLPTRGKHSRRLIALIVMALVVSSGVQWLADLAPSLSKTGTPPLFWPLFLLPLPFYLTPLWSVLSDGWRAPKSLPHSPGLHELWDLPAPGENRPLSCQERLVRALLQAENDAYLILLNRLDEVQLTSTCLRAAQTELFRRGETPPLSGHAGKWAADRLVQIAASVDMTGCDLDLKSLLSVSLDELPAESRRLLTPWLVGGASFAEILATSGLSSDALRNEIRTGLAQLTEAAELRLQEAGTQRQSFSPTVHCRK